MNQLAVKERVKEVLKNSKISINKLSVLINLPQKTLNNQISGDSAMGINVIQAISDYYNININWLLTGEGEMLKHPTQNIIHEYGIDYKEKYFDLLEKNNQLQSEMLEIKNKLLEAKEGANNVRDGVMAAKVS